MHCYGTFEIWMVTSFSGDGELSLILTDVDPVATETPVMERTEVSRVAFTNCAVARFGLGADAIKYGGTPALTATVLV